MKQKLILLIIVLSPFVSAFSINIFICFSTLLTAMLGIHYYSMVFVQSRRMIVDKALWLVLYCFFLSLITIFQGTGDKVINQYGQWMFSFVFFYFALRNEIYFVTQKDKTFFNKIKRAIFIAVLIASTFAVIEFFIVNTFGVDINSYVYRGRRPEYDPSALGGLFIRARSFMEESGHFTFFLECLSPLAIQYSLNNHRRLISSLFILTVLIALLVSFSAFSYVSLLMCLMIFLYYSLKEVKKNIVGILIFIAVIVAIVCLTDLYEIIETVISFKLDPSNASYSDREGRIANLGMYLNNESLLTGYGAGAYSSLGVYSFVSLYVNIIMNTGLIGLIIYILFLITQWRLIYKIKDIQTRMFFMMSFVTASMHLAIIDNIYIIWYWLLLSLAYCCYKLNLH